MIAQSRMERPVSISGAVTPEDIAESMQMVNRYVEPYRKLMGSAAEGQRLSWMVGGLTSNLERKSVEPIAVMYGVPRGQLQSFMGYSRWEHRPLLELMLSEVAREIGIPDGSLIVDGSGSPKKGTATVGVARQWCGNRGKVDNCVIGVYAVYVGAQNSAALVGAELFLPKEWTEDKERRDKSYVPEHIVYHSQAEIASGFVHDLAGRLPFEWVLGDDEFGRARHFRDAIAELQRGYVLDVPENTNARRVRRNGKLCKRLWTVKELAQSRPVREWQYFHVRDAEKGPVEVRVLSMEVATPREGKAWVHEKLLVIETTDGSQRWYCLAKPARPVEVLELVRQAGLRHRIEEVFEETKSDLGLDHYEVRAWHGWYHHMTLVQIAHWFLVREQRRMGGKITRHHGEPNSHGDCPAPEASPVSGPSSSLHQLPPSTQLRSQMCPLPGAWPSPSSATADHSFELLN